MLRNQVLELREAACMSGASRGTTTTGTRDYFGSRGLAPTRRTCRTRVWYSLCCGRRKRDDTVAGWNIRESRRLCGRDQSYRVTSFRLFHRLIWRVVISSITASNTFPASRSGALKEEPPGLDDPTLVVEGALTSVANTGL